MSEEISVSVCSSECSGVVEAGEQRGDAAGLQEIDDAP
jgi:hypothetical protein